MRRTTEDVLDVVAVLRGPGAGLVDGGLERGGRAAAVAAVGGDDDLGAEQSTRREASASAENPPKTTVCGAPMRAQASIATTVSGIIGM